MLRYGKAPTRKAGYYNTCTVHRDGGLIRGQMLTDSTLILLNPISTPAELGGSLGEHSSQGVHKEHTCTAEELIRC